MVVPSVMVYVVVPLLFFNPYHPFAQESSQPVPSSHQYTVPSGMAIVRVNM